MSLFITLQLLSISKINKQFWKGKISMGHCQFPTPWIRHWIEWILTQVLEHRYFASSNRSRKTAQRKNSRAAFCPNGSFLSLVIWLNYINKFILMYHRCFYFIYIHQFDQENSTNNNHFLSINFFYRSVPQVNHYRSIQ